MVVYVQIVMVLKLEVVIQILVHVIVVVTGHRGVRVVKLVEVVHRPVILLLELQRHTEVFLLITANVKHVNVTPLRVLRIAKDIGLPGVLVQILVVVVHKQVHGLLQLHLLTVALHALAQLQKVANAIQAHVLSIVWVRGGIIRHVINHVVVVHRQDHGPL